MINFSVYQNAYAKATLFDYSDGAGVHIRFGTEKIGELGYVGISASEARALAEELRDAAEKADALNRLREQASKITEAA